MSDNTQIFKGLAGVIVDETKISKVMPDINALVYRGYPVQDLADQCSFEEVAHLILKGELPNKSELDAFCQKEREYRSLSPELLEVIQKMPKSSHPMDAVRTGVSFLGQEDERTWDNSPECNQDKALRMLGKIPSITAAFYRHRKGEKFIPADTSKNMSENFFQMCFGEVPHEDIVKAFDASLTLYAEHSFNASTFTARVVASTTSDIYSATTAAVGALKGPLHGGANEQVMHVLKEIGSPDKALSWLEDALANKKKIMGFGHRVYRKGDSRAPTMDKYGRKVAAIKGDMKWHEISEVLEKEMIAKKNIYPNLDFPAGPAYYLMGFEIDFFTPIFVIARTTGWSAHVMEQLAGNRLIRPLSAYNGNEKRDVKALADR